MNHSEMRNFFIIPLISKVQIWVLGVNSFFLQFLVVNILPLGSGSVNLHIFANPDPKSQNLEDPDPKHCKVTWRALCTKLRFNIQFGYRDKKAVLRIRIRWISNIFASWIRIRKNMRIHGSESKGQNYKKTAKKSFALKTITVKKEIIKYFLIYIRFIKSSSFNIKISEKKIYKLKIFFFYKISKCYE